MRLRSLARSGAWMVADLFFGVWGMARRLRSGSRQPMPLRETHSILVIRLDLVGDLVFTLLAIQALREAAPGARITLLALPYTAGLAQNLPYIGRVIAADVNRWRKPGEWIRGPAWGELRQVVSAIREENPDLCVSFYGRVGAAFALLSGARFLVGYRSEGYTRTFDLAVEGKRYRQRQHEMEYCLDLVRALVSRHGGSNVGVGGPSGPWVPASPAEQSDASLPGERSFASVQDGSSCQDGRRDQEGGAQSVRPPGTGKILQVDPEAAARVDGLLSEAGVPPSEPLVALHPGALNTPIKRWLTERWAAVADRIQSELGYRVVLVGSAAELPLVEVVQRQMNSPAVVLAGKTSLSDLVALLARCCLFLGGDSGPLHVASALGVPSVSVYGPTDPAITGPIVGRGTGGAARTLTARAECIPCYDPGRPPECRRSDLLCMAMVTVDNVFDAAKDVLDGNCWQRLPQETSHHPT